MLTNDTFREMVEYAKGHLSDIIPYDDPDYDKKLEELAVAYASEVLGPNSNV